MNSSIQECSLLLPYMVSKNYVIVGSGPSLVYSIDEIHLLNNETTTFLLSDSIAFPFILLFKPKNYIIFTVEHRSHSYLKQFINTKICIYEKANFFNLPRTKNNLFYFHYPHTENPISRITLLSLGTVVGTMLSWCLYAFKAELVQKKIYFAGVDLCFIDHQMYNKFLSYTMYTSRFSTFESAEYYRTLKKSAFFLSYQEFLIKTSHEFLETKKNILTIIEEVKQKYGDLVLFKEFSPIGFLSNYVQKIVPKL